tara:strand:+ start:509 stop:649 length:141 start_codon:yes stop_codon:yes gene_type:complete
MNKPSIRKIKGTRNGIIIRAFKELFFLIETILPKLKKGLRVRRHAI